MQLVEEPKLENSFTHLVRIVAPHTSAVIFHRHQSHNLARLAFLHGPKRAPGSWVSLAPTSLPTSLEHNPDCGVTRSMGTKWP